MTDFPVRTIDQETGEDLTYNSQPFNEDENDLVPFSSPIMKSILSGNLPDYMRVLVDKHIDDPEMADVEYSMFAGVDAVNLKDYLAKVGPFEVNVKGCAILPHDAYVGMDGEMHDGYWQTFILTDKKDQDTGKDMVFVSSSPSLARHVAFACHQRGWYLWSKPIKHRISASAKKGAHLMENLERPAIAAPRATEHRKA